MKLSRNNILKLTPEKHSCKTLSLAYSILVDELMQITKKEKTSRRNLKRTSQILNQMESLGDYVVYHPEYFDKQGNNLVNLLRHGARYLEKNDFYDENNHDSGSIGELFAFKITVKDIRLQPSFENYPIMVPA